MKKLVTLAMVMAFVVGTAGMSMAAKVTCKVKTIDGKTVTMECKKADTLKIGQKSTVKEKKVMAN